MRVAQWPLYQGIIFIGLYRLHNYCACVDWWQTRPACIYYIEKFSRCTTRLARSHSPITGVPLINCRGSTTPVSFTTNSLQNSSYKVNQTIEEPNVKDTHRKKKMDHENESSAQTVVPQIVVNDDPLGPAYSIPNFLLPSPPKKIVVSWLRTQCMFGTC